MPFSHDSIYNPVQPGAWRVLVMRRWPRGLRKDRIDEWLRDAAPSASLLERYQQGEIDFEQLARRYQAEIGSATLDYLRDLERQHGHVVLLCWERPPKRCHREVLVRILTS